MEGDGSSDGVNREFGVEEGATRMRGPRTRKPRGVGVNWTERAMPKSSNDVQGNESGEVRHPSSDAMDASEVDIGMGLRQAVPGFLRGNSDDDGGNESSFEGRGQPGTEEGTEVVEVSEWRYPRRHRWHRSSRAAVPERSGPGPFAELLNRGASGSEASGSRDSGVQENFALTAFSSDEEDAVGTGKKPVHDVIDLSVSPAAGPASNGSEEAGPSQSSGDSPLRRVLQRPAFADAKRARRIVHRSGLAQPENRTVEDGGTSAEDRSEVEPSGDVAPPPLEPYNLRSARSVSFGGVPLNRLDRRSLQALRGRVRRPRFTPAVGFSDLNNLRQPFFFPSPADNGNRTAPGEAVVNLEDQESPTVVGVSPGNAIVLEDDGESERTRQLAEDERVARELQNSFALEDEPPADEVLARMLQAEENSHGHRLPIEQRPIMFAPTGMRSLLGGDEDEREARRLFRNELAMGHMPDHVASSSRIVRRGFGRNASLNRVPPPEFMNRPFHFPAGMGMESRVEFLDALERAFEQVPVGLRLAHVDRDFNENDYEMLLALDTDNHRHRGASLESINQLPVTTIAPTDVIDEDCSICLETPKAGDALKRLPCMHAFHRQCIDEWLQQQAVCPVCKAHI